MSISPFKAAFALAALLVTSCEGEGLTTSETAEAAKERVRESLGLTREAALFTNVFVGEPVDGQPVLCGKVEGRRGDGTMITPRRFIAATDPARWLQFEPATGLDLPSRPEKFVEWHKVCAGEEEVR